MRRAVCWAFVLSFISICISCGDANSTISLPPSSAKTLLSITTNFRGALWIQGEVLDFQLQEDGTIEFDEYPVDTPTAVRAEEVRVRKRYRISAQEVNDLMNQVSSPEFRELNDRYELVAPSCDAHYDREIKTNSQTIRIPVWCGLEEPPRFPEPLANLLNAIRNIKSRELGKRLPTP